MAAAEKALEIENVSDIGDSSSQTYICEGGSDDARMAGRNAVVNLCLTSLRHIREVVVNRRYAVASINGIKAKVSNKLASGK